MIEYRELTEGVTNVLIDGRPVGQFYARTGNFPLVRRVSEANIERIRGDLKERGFEINAVTPPPPEIPELYRR